MLDWWLPFWTSIDDAQASIVSAALTVLAAIIGVLLGAWLFAGRVGTLKDAVDASDKVLKDHKGTVEATLAQIREQISSLEDQLNATFQSLGQLRGSVGDLQSNVEVKADEPQNVGTTLPVNPNADGQPAVEALSAREKLRVEWDKIRDRIEAIAADRAIDGRTRSRYARVDRRSYDDLVVMLAHDGRLGDSADAYRSTLALWSRFRSGRATPTDADVAAMARLRRALGL